MYAGDLLCPHLYQDSKLVQVCGLYGLNCDIIYNFKKSAVLICKTKYMKKCDVPPFKISSETIQDFDNVKYLGRFISSTLHGDKDILWQSQ